MTETVAKKIKKAPLSQRKTVPYTTQTTNSGGFLWLLYYGARYLDPKTSRWLSSDPALGEYIPVAPLGENEKKHNSNLPGMGGVFNLVNLHVYHYGGNNPVKYVDPDGRIWTDNGDGTFTATPGDTLWGLAEQVFGDGSRWQEFGFEGDPAKLQVGETVEKKHEEIKGNNINDSILTKPSSNIETTFLLRDPLREPFWNVFKSWASKKTGENLTIEEANLQIVIGGVEFLGGFFGGLGITVLAKHPGPFLTGLFIMGDGAVVISYGLNKSKRTPLNFTITTLWPIGLEPPRF